MWDWKTVILGLPPWWNDQKKDEKGILPLELTRGLGALVSHWTNVIGFLYGRGILGVFEPRMFNVYGKCHVYHVYIIDIYIYILYICNICIYTYPIISYHIISYHIIIVYTMAKIAVFCQKQCLAASLLASCPGEILPKSCGPKVWRRRPRVSLMTQGGYRLILRYKQKKWQPYTCVLLSKTLF